MSQQELTAMAEMVPMMLVGQHFPGAAGVDTVNNNDVLGTRLTVQHLAEAGYRDIVYFTLKLDQPADGMTFWERELGYRAAMEEHGLASRIRVVKALQIQRDIQVAARHLLTSRNRPEAIFCWTDFVALEVMSVATELGLAVPGDVAITGYDNTLYCDLAQNGLTSVDQSCPVLGLQAARLLIERIKGRETSEHLVVAPRLVVRASSRARR